MAQMTSDEALNGIFNILETFANQVAERQAEQQNDSSSDTGNIIEQLLSGAVANDSKGGVGSQVEALAKGMVVIKKNDIKESDGELVAKVIDSIGTSISRLNFSEANTQGVEAIVRALVLLGSVDKKIIQGLKRLDDMDWNVADQIVSFVNKLNFVDSEVLKDDQMAKSLGNLAKFMGEVVKIMDASTFRLRDIMGPIKGWILGKSLGAFFDAMIKAVPAARIKLQLRGVSDIMKAFMPLIADESKISVRRLRKILNEKNGEHIGMFFGALIDSIPDNRKIDQSVKHVAQIVNAICEGNYESIKKSLKLFNEKNGERIGMFFAKMLEHLDGRDKIVDLKPISDFIKTLSEISVAGAIALKLLKGTVNEKFGEGLNKFIKKLTEGVTQEMADQASMFTKSVKEMASGVLILTISVGLVAGMFALLGPVNVIESMVALTIFTGAMIGILAMVSKRIKDIQEGGKALIMVGAAITILTFDVIMLTGVAERMRLIDWESLGKTIVMLGVVAIAAGIMLKIGDLWREGGKNALIAMIGFSIVMLTAASTLETLVNISARYEFKDIFGGLAMMMVTIGFLTGMVVWLNKAVPKQELVYATVAMVGMAIVMVMVASSLDTIVKVGAKYSAVELLSGYLVLGGTIVLLTGMVKWLNGVDSKNILYAVAAVAGMALVTLGVALIIRDLFIPIGAPEVIAQSALGMLVVGGTVALLTGMVAFLNHFVKTKDVLWGVTAVAGMALITLGISLIVKELFIPIGKHADEAALGGTVVLATLAVFGGIAIGLGYFIEKLEGGKIIKDGILAVAGIAVVVWLTAQATMTLVKLANDIKGSGLEFGDVVKAGGLMVGVIGVFGAIGYGVGKLVEKVNERTLIEGGLVIAGISAVVWLLSHATDAFVEVAKKVKDLSISEILATGGLMIGILGVFGGLMAGIGLLMDTGIGAAVLASGAAAIVGIAGVVWVVAEMTEQYVDIARGLANVKVEEINKGTDIILGVLMKFGEVILAVGGAITLTLGLGGVALAAGMGAMTAVAGTMKLVGGIVSDFAGIAIMIKGLNGGDKYENGQIKPGVDVMLNILQDYKKVMDEFGLGTLVKTAIMKYYLSSIDQLTAVMDKFTNLILKIKENIKPDEISSFYKIIVGEGLKDKTSMLGTIGMVTEAFQTMSKKILFGFDPIRAVRSAEVILDVCSKFIDVVAKVANLTYIMGYDDNGKPMYGRIEPSTFNEAANVVTTQFGNFVTAMTTGFKDIGFMSVLFSEVVAFAMRPVIDTVSKFVDVVLKLATSRYVIGYDKNGKPEYMQVSPSDFTEAANVIVDSFIYFVDQLTSRMNTDVKTSTLIAIDLIGECLKPVIDCVGGFVDAIMKLATGTYITGYDEQGHAEIAKVTANDFDAAATQVVKHFATFIDKITERAKDLSIMGAFVIDLLGESLGSVLSSVGSFVDAIMKVATGQYPDDWDENGKVIHYKHLDATEFASAAEKICEKFGFFLTSMETSCKDLSWRTVSVIEELGKGIEPVMKSVATFADAILKLATGVYQDGVTKDGKPIFKKLSNKDIDNAAYRITYWYDKFLTKVLNLASSEKFQKSGAKAMEALAKSVGPVMDSVVDFSNMLVTFLQPHGTIKDANGKERSFRLDMRTISDAATKIANAYITFVNTLITKIESTQGFVEKVSKATSYMSQVAKVSTSAANGAEAMGKLFKALGDIKGLDKAAANRKDAPTVQFVDTIMNLLNGIISDNPNYILGKTYMETCNKFLKLMIEGSKHLKVIMNNLGDIKNLKNYEVVCGNFAGAIDKLASADYKKIQPIDQLIPFLQIAKVSSVMLKQIATTMMDVNLKNGVSQFVENITLLTNQTTNHDVDVTRKSMNVFSNDLKKFGVQLQSATKIVIKFTQEENRLTNAIRNMDRYLINGEKKRAEVLNEMATLVGKLADEVGRLKTQFEQMDENKVIGNIRSLVGMVEMMKSEAVSQNANASTQTSQSPTQRGVAPSVNGKQQTNQTSNGGNGGISVALPYQGDVIVEFVFQDTRFTGFMKTKHI